MKRFFAYSAIGTALLFLLGGTLLLSRLMQFENELAALEDEGVPVSIADLEVGPTADQVDATKQFSRLLGPLGSFESEMYEVYNEGQTDETAVKLFNELNLAYPTVYPLISEVANADFVGFEKKGVAAEETLDFELNRLQQVRSCARVLDFRSKILAAQGKPDEAFQSATEIFKLCETFDKHPTLIAHLVRCAMRGIATSSAYEILSNHDVTKENREQLNELLEKYEASDGLRWTLVSERAFGASMLSEMGTILLAFNGSAYLDLIQCELDQCDKEYFEKDLSSEQDVDLIDSMGAAMILPALRQTRLSNARVKSRVRGLRIVNALTENPESAEKEITKQYLVSLGVPEPMTIDTMNGEPMKVKRIDDQWVVYSVGENLVDDVGDSKMATVFFGVGPDPEE